MSRVVIYNRNDGDASHASAVSGRLSNSVVSLINYQGNTLKTYRIGDATNVPVVDINFDSTGGGGPAPTPNPPPTPNPALVHKVRVQLLGTNFLNLREVQVFDQNGVNRALNKPATQSSTTPGYEASKIVNGNLNDMSHTNWEAGMYHEWTKSNLTVTAPFHSKRLTLSLTLVLI